MTTIARRFERGNYYHVYNRGNHKDMVFRDARDRRYFLSKLDEFCERDGQTLVAYCLMDNHFHLLLRQEGANSLSVTMRSLMAGYVRMYNTKYRTVGGLFQGRFKAKPVQDEGYLIHLTRYIHLNPHPFVDYRKYGWSSYRQYASDKPGLC